MKRAITLAILMTCAGCTNGQKDESNASVTKSRADALEKKADETTNALIKTLDSEVAEDAAPATKAKDNPPKKK